MTERTSTPRPTPDGTREWEVFVRESPAESLRHAGSVTAPTAAVARDAAGTLFDHAAEGLWLCPAGAVRRFAERELGGDYADDPGPDLDSDSDSDPDPKPEPEPDLDTDRSADDRGESA
ncbi:MAG: Htur_1727 family rSAM-partnered candidate RiPP [Halolamina sp.]